jgi:uncharacterized RDD family membrane protein YckC
MYPRLIRRVQAVLIDSAVLLVVFVFSVALAGYLKLKNDLFGAAIAFLPVILVEPLLVSIKGGTIGHLILGLRVRSTFDNKNLNIFIAILRTITKVTLGMVSLVCVLTTKKHQAIHDLITGSIVVINDPKSLPTDQVLAERVLDHEKYSYPGVIRRLLFIFLYFILFIIFMGIFFTYALSDSCIEHNGCNYIDSIVYVFISIFYWLGIFGIPALGWMSKLYGCRKVQKNI